MITLVELNNKWIIEDACFNVEYRDLKNNLLDINSLLRYLDNKEDNLVTIIDNSDVGKMGLSKEKLSHNDFTYKVDNISYTENNLYIFDTEISLKYEPFEKLYPYFTEDGYNSNQIYIYEYPYNVYIYPYDIRSLWDFLTIKYFILGNRM